MQEFFEGVASGATKIPQGVLETVVLIPDYLAGTDYGRDVTESFEQFRSRFGIDPRGIAGTIGEVGTQFVLPGALAAKAVGAVSKAGRAGTFLRQLGAAGATDAVVATNDTTSLGDFFEGGPTDLAEDIGLQGEQEAVRRALNKLKIGVEGAAGVVAAPFIARGVAEAGGAAATALGQIPGATQAARAVQRGAQAVGRGLARIEEGARTGQPMNPFKKALGETLATLRYRGMLPEEIGEARSLVIGRTEAELQEATKRADRLDSMLDSAIRDFNKVMAPATPLTRADTLNSIEKFLTSTDRKYAGQLLQTSIPQPLHADLQKMRNQIDALSSDILSGPYLQQVGGVTPVGASQTINDIIKDNLGSYMRRRYRIFETEDYMPDAATREAGVRGFLATRKATENMFKKLLDSGKYTVQQLPPGVMSDGTIQGPITRQQAELAADEFVQSYKTRNVSKGLSRVAENRLPTDLLITRTNLLPFQRALLGEVHNPLENYVATVADLAEFKAVDDYFGRIAELAQQNPNTFGRLFKDTSGMSPQQLGYLREQGNRILGEADDPLASPWGALQNFAVPERIYRDLTRTVAGDLGVANAARSLYSGFLRAKGGAQYAATVLSPVTQIRNVTTSSLFSLMQGNVGRGADIFDSVRLVYDNLSPTKMTDRFKKMQQLGVIGTQAQLREIQDLVRKGFGFTDQTSVNGLPTARRVGSWVTDNPIGSFFRGIGQRAENLYQGGDDLWKIYNFEFERNKLANALGKMDPQAQASYIAGKAGRPMSLDDYLDDEAARIVRNVIPNYNLAPEVIKGLRRLPIGNFIAFPYEIMRTSMNTIARGIDELADTNVEIQKIGMRRLLGATTTLGVLGPTLSGLAYQLSGVSEDEMKAYQRTIAPPWERNARLIPTGRQEDGTPKYINWSYSNPYDMLEKMAVSAINKFEEGQALGKSGDQIAFEAFSESFYELMSPFTEEAIITAKLRDVLDPNAKVPVVRQLAQLAGGRAGETLTGARVYNPQDSAGDKAAKSFAHVIDAIVPPLVPVEVRGGEFEPSRVARGLVNSLGLNEELGVSEKDRRGIERDLSEELARAFSGVAESENTATIGLRFKGFEFASAVRDSSNIFNSVARRQNVRSEDLLRAYVDANEARYRVFNEFHQLVEDLTVFGMKKQQIRRVLENLNIGGVDAIMRNRYEPMPISDTVLDEMRRNGTINQLPRGEIRRIQLEQRSRKYGGEPTEVTPPPGFILDQAPQPTFVPRPTERQGAAVPPPTFVPGPAPAGPQTPQAPAERASLSPSILGANPVSQARNAEIAQRQASA